MYWLNHHRLFEHVERQTQALMALGIVWMMTIIWLPVPTAISGSLCVAPQGETCQGDVGAAGPVSYDRGSLAIYIGSLFLTSLVSLALGHYVLRHPELWKADDPPTRHGLSAPLAMTILFAVALVLALAIPQLSYFPLFLMFLTGPLEALLFRRLTRSRAAE